MIARLFRLGLGKWYSKRTEISRENRSFDLKTHLPLSIMSELSWASIRKLENCTWVWLLAGSILRFAVFSSFFLMAGSVPAQPLPAIELRPVFPELRTELPVGMAEAPDGSGRFFILEQDGRIIVLRKGSDGKERKEFLNIVDRKPHVNLEEGLLGLAFHPGFKTNGLCYIYYSQQDPRRSVLSEIKVSTEDPDRADMKSERHVLVVPQPFENHKSGQLGFGPDGYFYVA